MRQVYVVTEIGEYPWDANVCLVLSTDRFTFEKEMKERVEALARDSYPRGTIGDEPEDGEWEWDNPSANEWTYSYDDGGGGDVGYLVSLSAVEEA